MEIARKVSEEQAIPLAGESIVREEGCEVSEISPEHRRLLAAGFKPKERGGLTIWERPDTGFYVSQEMALHLLRRTKGSA